MSAAAMLHHIDQADGQARLRRLVALGGVLLVGGLTRFRSQPDVARVAAPPGPGVSPGGEPGGGRRRRTTMHRSNTVHRLLVLVALLAAFGLVLAACGPSAPLSTTGAPATSETGSSASTTAGRLPEGTAVPPTDPSTVPSDVVTTGTSQPPSIRAVSQAQLTEPWGCGHGFAATNATRTIALVLQPEAPPRVGSSTVTLPDPAWHGHLDLGRDLLSVACADLDVRRSPAADETWPVVHGTLRIDAPASASGCAPSPISARVVATDLSVEAPDGTIITFPELTMTNDQWGCSAG